VMRTQDVRYEVCRISGSIIKCKIQAYCVRTYWSAYIHIYISYECSMHTFG
jgi:hypothetical protein